MTAGLPGEQAGREATATVRAVAAPATRARLPFIPRSVLGLSALVLFTSLGAAFSGAVLFSYYQYRLDQNTRSLTAVAEKAQKALKDAGALIEAEKERAKEEIRAELGPLKQLAASEEVLRRLLDKVTPSVWFVQTLDDAGQPSVGSAFVVASDGDQSFLLTSLAVVRAATRTPGPQVTVRKGNDEIRATLHTWDEARDLALLIVSRPNLPKLPWRSGADAARIGERLFAVSGLGGSGGAIVQGQIADVFADGIVHTAPVGASFRGGPLVNSDGEVLGVASADYAPLGFPPGDVTFGVPVARACERVLRCPSG
jgi:S1-C subfamily serine protease